jgi:hypothetical protein
VTLSKEALERLQQDPRAIPELFHALVSLLDSVEWITSPAWQQTEPYAKARQLIDRITAKGTDGQHVR